ncbi:MAG: Bug family tripartite tricarboxylate transporter substrate binding protein [Hyphomicrobiaceae bacterium]
MVLLQARRQLKTDMVVVNKRGGGGATAMNYFITRPADGYTLLAFTVGHAATVVSKKTKMKLDDIIPVARGTDDPQILMVACKKSPYKTAKDFVAAQKTKQLSYGITGVGTIDHVSAFMFTKRGGMKAPKVIAFKGGGEIATNLVAGNIDVGVLNYSEAAAQIEAGEICPLVVQATERMALLPKVMTTKELGIDAHYSTVRGFAVLKGTPPDRVAALEKGLVAAMKNPVYQAYLKSVGLTPQSVGDAKAWAAQIKSMSADMEAALVELGFIKKK